MSKPRISVNLATRLLNTPLAIKSDYFLTMLGALQDRGLPVLAINDGQSQFNSEQLHELAGSYQDDNERASSTPYYIVDSVAYVNVSGALVHKYGHLNPYSGMTGYDGIRANIELALGDQRVKAIVLDMDSPGGEVSGCFALGDFIFSQVRGQKPIWALVDELSCSASYAIAAACDRIILTETAIAGSIGVICGHTDMTKAYEDAGFKVTLFYSGSHKADMHPLKPMDDALSTELQANMVELHSLFSEKVALWRNIPVQSVKDTESQVYRGQKAVDVGLADAVMSTDDFHIELINHTAAKGGNNLGVNTMSKQAATIAATVGASALINNASAAVGTELDANEPAATIDATTVANSERERVFAILDSEAAATRPGLAKTLAGMPNMSLEQATLLLNAAAPESAQAQSVNQLTSLMNEHAEQALDDDDATVTTDELASMNSVMDKAYGKRKAPGAR
jgi:signal peptide peptidase SppA